MTEAEARLVGALAGEERGPGQNGIFALWLFTRVAEAVAPSDPVSPRGHRRRVELLQRRLGSVSMPAPLRRALSGALRLVAEGTPRSAALALQQLVAPARETVGPEVADALAAAATRIGRMARGAGSA
jgi:hypothetical protein